MSLHRHAANRTWVMDVTYCRTWSGFAYVALFVDVFAQRILAWHAATLTDGSARASAEGPPLRPLRNAYAPWNKPVLRRPLDSGQHASVRFTEHLSLEGVRPSIGSGHDAYDNALMECLIGLYKTESIRTTIFHEGPFKTLADVENAPAGWVDWHSTRRLHSSLAYVTPIESETAHYAARNLGPQPL